MRQDAANAASCRVKRRCSACLAAWARWPVRSFMVRLTQLTPAARDQDHIPTVLWSDPRVPDRTVAQPRGRGRSAALAAARRPGPSARGLRRDRHPVQHGASLVRCHVRCGGGADLAYRRCRGAELRRHGTEVARVGVMATQAALAMRLYQDRLGALGWDCIVPGQEEMDRLVSPAIGSVKLNRMVDAYAPLAAVVRSLADRGAVAVVLRLYRNTARHSGRAPAGGADRRYHRRAGPRRDRLGETVTTSERGSDEAPRCQPHPQGSPCQST